MPDISFDTLHLEQGFNFRGDIQDACGFITTVNLLAAPGMTPTKLLQDISVSLPPTQDGTPPKESVVGVMRSFKWASGLTDPIELKFNISTKNRNTVFGLLQDPGKFTSTAVEVAFQIFYFDQTQAMWYLTMGGAATAGLDVLKGNVAKEGKEKLLLSLPSNLQSETVKSPPNWECDLSVMPQSLAQGILYQYSPGQKLVKNWGVTVL